MALRGEKGWHAAHAANYGEERWIELHNAFHREVEHVCFLNPFLSQDVKKQIEHDYSLQPTPIPGAYTFEIPEDPSVQYNTIEENDADTIFVESKPMSLAPFFFIDGGSAIAALALDAQPEDRVLEVCAGLGGKALVIASAMFAGRCHEHHDHELHGHLICNEVSKPKASRMQRIMTSFLPGIILDPSRRRGPHVIFTTADAGTPHNTMDRHGPYDKIILDAPCTNDRLHLRNGPTGKLNTWSNGTAKVAADKQVKLLYNALWWLKEDGVLLYCNSALAHEECDGVIERLFVKARGDFVLDVLPLEERVCRMVPGLAAESTDWGTRILPDKSPFGPIYFSRLLMVKRTHQGSTVPGMPF